jgi:hypothetical protein
MEMGLESLQPKAVGYKAFQQDWTCRDYQYKVGEFHKIDGKPKLCQSGFHFCQWSTNVDEYYLPHTPWRYALVEAYGDIDEGDDKICTNILRVVKEISREELEQAATGIRIIEHTKCRFLNNKQVPLYDNPNSCWEVNIENGTQRWLDDVGRELHRLNGPAFVSTSGLCYYYIYGYYYHSAVEYREKLRKLKIDNEWTTAYDAEHL